MQFELTFDYLCPFARNASEAVLAAVALDVEIYPRFRPFSLTQVHVEEGEPAVWNEPVGKSGVLALQWGVAVRDGEPALFPAVHRALFAARHDHGLDIKDERVVREAVGSAGADVERAADLVASGIPLKTIEAEHTEAVERWSVFGVPTFIAGDEAVYVRFMERGRVDDLDRVLGMIEWTRLNEFKRTRVPR
jgi:predicted DsbA family dithiol-disulfide isomerase